MGKPATRRVATKKRPAVKELSRTPPEAVKLALRREVGNGCPVAGCASPYLEYHHFDPPWRIEHHHRPAGMIALCAIHHPKADAGSFTVEQLRSLKSASFALSAGVRGRFDWRRRELIARIGGTFFVHNSTMVRIGGHNVISQRRDEDGMLLLSLDMRRLSPESKLRMIDHEWISQGLPESLESPPSGRLLAVRYASGDALKIEFWEASDAGAFASRYTRDGDPPGAVPNGVGLEFPLAIAEIEMHLPSAGIDFGKDATTLPNFIGHGNWVIRSGLAGLAINEPRPASPGQLSSDERGSTPRAE